MGFLFIVVGLLQLISEAKGIWLSLFLLFRLNAYPSLLGYLIFNIAFLFFLIILPLAILSAGIGIIKMRRWGWRLAITVCSITLVIKLIGAVNYAFAVYMAGNNLSPHIPAGAIAVFPISMWYSYIYGIVSGLLILILTRKSTKKAFYS